MAQLAEVPKNESLELAHVTPMQLLQSAVMQGAAIDTIERLAALAKDMREYEAKIAFDAALFGTSAKKGSNEHPRYIR